MQAGRSRLPAPTASCFSAQFRRACRPIPRSSSSAPTAMMIVVANHNIGSQMLHPNSTCGNSRKLPPLRQTHWMGDGLTRSNPPLNEPLAADSIRQPGVCSDTYNKRRVLHSTASGSRTSCGTAIGALSRLDTG